MYKSLFLVSDVDKGSIKGWKNLLYFSEEYVSYGEVVTLAGLLVQLDKQWFSISAIETSVELTSTIRSFSDSIRNFSVKNFLKLKRPTTRPASL